MIMNPARLLAVTVVACIVVFAVAVYVTGALRVHH